MKKMLAFISALCAVILVTETQLSIIADASETVLADYATITDGIYVLKNVGSGYAMNYGYGLPYPKPIVMSIAGDEDNHEQHFKFTYTTDGKFIIQTMYPAEMGVDIITCEEPVSSGSAIITRSNITEFYVTPMEDGTYILQIASNPDLVISAESKEWHSPLILQQYAAEETLQRWTFTPEPTALPVISYGDADGSGKVDILDVITVNRAILGKEKLTDEQLKAVDFNSNGKPDSSEALMIMKYIVGLITDLTA